MPAHAFADVKDKRQRVGLLPALRQHTTQCELRRHVASKIRVLVPVDGPVNDAEFLDDEARNTSGPAADPGVNGDVIGIFPDPGE